MVIITLRFVGKIFQTALQPAFVGVGGGGSDGRGQQPLQFLPRLKFGSGKSIGSDQRTIQFIQLGRLQGRARRRRRVGGRYGYVGR